MKVSFPLEEIFGRPPREVSKLFLSQGIDPKRPYRATVNFNKVVIEQTLTSADQMTPH